MSNKPSREWGDYIPSGGINDVIASWQDKQPEREQNCATPSTLTDCPLTIWLHKHGVPYTNPLGWGIKQRMMLGRITENTIARQLKEEGLLLHHWNDDHDGDAVKFAHGSGLTRIEGVADLLIKLLDRRVAISDSKTSRSDSFKWVGIKPSEIWADPFWNKYRIQVNAYFMLCHWNKEWFSKNKLPLPEVCHLFAYALDDGIVRREITWRPNSTDAAEVMNYIRRWNKAYASETPPECTCERDGTVKLCRYGLKEEGMRICLTCCGEDLIEKVRSKG